MLYIIDNKLNLAFFIKEGYISCSNIVNGEPDYKNGIMLKNMPDNEQLSDDYISELMSQLIKENSFAYEMITKFIPILQKLLASEINHYEKLKEHVKLGSKIAVEFIETSKLSIEHFEKRIKEYKEYTKKVLDESLPKNV